MSIVFQLKQIEVKKNINVIFPIYDFSAFFNSIDVENYLTISNINDFTDKIKNIDFTQYNDSQLESFEDLVDLLPNQSAGITARKIDFYINTILDFLHYNSNLILVNCSNASDSVNTDRIKQASLENKASFIIFDPLRKTISASAITVFKELEIPIVFNSRMLESGNYDIIELKYISLNTTDISKNFTDFYSRSELGSDSNFDYLSFSVIGIKRIKRYYLLEDSTEASYTNSPYTIVPLAIDAAGSLLRSYSLFPWYSPAGFERGKVLNQIFSKLDVEEITLTEGIIPQTPSNTDGSVATTDLGIAYSRKLNTILKVPDANNKSFYYLLSDLNGITNSTNINKTSISYTNLLSYIKKNVKSLMFTYMFEQNDEDLRDAVQTQIEIFLESIKATSGIDQYNVVCDESNNSEEDQKNRKLNVDVYFKPSQSIDYVELSFTT
jgi:hypothetical protein